MTRMFISTALFLVVTATTLAQTQPTKTDKPAKAEQEVFALNQKWADAIVAGDMEALDRLFSDDLILTSGNGSIRGKKEEMDDLRPTADIKTYFFNVDDVRVRVYGDAAVVTGRAKWRINLKGRDIDNERRYTSVFILQKGRWQIVAQQLTKIGQPQMK